METKRFGVLYADVADMRFESLTLHSIALSEAEAKSALENAVLLEYKKWRNIAFRNDVADVNAYEFSINFENQIIHDPLVDQFIDGQEKSDLPEPDDGREWLDREYWDDDPPEAEGFTLRASETAASLSQFYGGYYFSVIELPSDAKFAVVSAKQASQAYMPDPEFSVDGVFNSAEEAYAGLKSAVAATAANYADAINPGACASFDSDGWPEDNAAFWVVLTYRCHSDDVEEAILYMEEEYDLPDVAWRVVQIP